MKKRLLVPPENDQEILLLPEKKDFTRIVSECKKMTLCHQPDFFNPGIALKFLLLDNLEVLKKDIIFMDTDATRLFVRFPGKGSVVNIKYLINTDNVLADIQTPAKLIIAEFLSSIEETIKEFMLQSTDNLIINFTKFKDIFLQNCDKKSLKEVLAASFMQYFGLKQNYTFLSEVLRCKDYDDFLQRICKDHNSFRAIFNSALDEYKETFKFRFKNFPYPQLEQGELPFWIIKDKKRARCFIKDIDLTKPTKTKIFPRAVALTLFLRLYRADVFIHGIGGANYEWIQNRVIERFYKQKPPDFITISGTFFLSNIKERQFPYFFFDSISIDKTMKNFLKKPK